MKRNSRTDVIQYNDVQFDISEMKQQMHMLPFLTQMDEITYLSQNEKLTKNLLDERLYACLAAELENFYHIPSLKYALLAEGIDPGAKIGSHFIYMIAKKYKEELDCIKEQYKDEHKSESQIKMLDMAFEEDAGRAAVVYTVLYLKYLTFNKIIPPEEDIPVENAPDFTAAELEDKISLNIKDIIYEFKNALVQNKTIADDDAAELSAAELKKLKNVLLFSSVSKRKE